MVTKQKTITDKEQRLAANILGDFEILTMRHNGPYSFEEIWEVVQKNVEIYGLMQDPFTRMICTSKEYVEASHKYECQLADEKYGHHDWLD